MANDNLDLVPIVDDDGVLAGRHDDARPREAVHPRVARRPRASATRATTVGAIVHVLEGEMVAGEDQEIGGRDLGQHDGDRVGADADRGRAT